MADKRVIEQTASSEIYNDDWFLKDSVLNGTTKISAENLAKGLIDNVDASDIAYDNSSSGLEADNVNGAIDELSSEKANLSDLATVATSGEAEDVSYDNTTSGLTATNVQDAIDETFENAGKVADVKVDGTSVVTNKVAEIEIPVKDVQVKTDSAYDSVVDASGNAKIDLSSVTAYGEVTNLPQAIATFKDGADAPMKSLKVAIEPQQEGSGDPSPSNPRPISGWSSVNVAVNGINFMPNIPVDYTSGQTLIEYPREVTFNGYYFSMIFSGRFVNGGASFAIGINEAGQNVAFITPNYLKKKSDDSALVANTTYTNEPVYFSSDATITVKKFALYTYPSFSNLSISETMFANGSTAQTYEPYNGHTYTIDLNGTRYGGKLDVVNGVLTVDRGYFKYININTTSGVAVTYGWRCNFTCPTDDINKGKWSIQTDATPIFNKISVVTKGYGANEYTVTLPNVTSKQEADAMLEGLEICYKLITPITYQLTPTQVKSLLGNNNVWADTGDINECVYRRDMSSTIDDIIARIEALEG